MSHIYKILNILNDKLYVGQSKVDPEIHWRNYKYGATHHKKYNKLGRPILGALIKHGFENFKYEVIEECSDEQLNDRERYWIAKLNTNIRMGGYGYNLTVGGQDFYTRKPQTHKKPTPETNEKIRQAHKYRSHVGWRKAPYTDEEIQNRSQGANQQKVRIERWSTDGQFLELHDSRSAVQIWLSEQGLTKATQRVIPVKIGHVMLSHGFYWRVAGDDVHVPKVKTKSSWIAVDQLSLNGNIVATFSSIKHAVLALKELGIGAHKDTIKACLTGEKETAYGFKWQCAQF